MTSGTARPRPTAQTGPGPAPGRVVDEVISVVTATLGIAARRSEITPATELLGNVSELDSLAVLEVVAALESRFGIRLDDDDVVAESFATFGRLAGLVEARSR